MNQQLKSGMEFMLHGKRYHVGQLSPSTGRVVPVPDDGKLLTVTFDQLGMEFVSGHVKFPDLGQES